MSNRLGGKQGTAYTGTNANQPPNWTFNNRPPTQYDTQNVSVGDLWLDSSAQGLERVWVLVSLAGDATSKGSLAQWEQFGSGALETITGNTGGPIGPDGNDNINIISAIVGLTVDGNPATNTLTLNSSGAHPLLQTLTGDVGGAVSADNNGNINILAAPDAGGTVSINGTPNTLTLSVTASSSNTIIGEGAGYNITSTIESTGLGYNSLASLTTGTRNTAVGNSALNAVTTATSNTAIGGRSALKTTGANNTALGADSLRENTTGANNTALGQDSLANLTIGSFNIGLGQASGVNYTTEASNIVIGNAGTIADANIVRIGTFGTGSGQQNFTVIHSGNVIKPNSCAFSAYWNADTLNATGNGTTYNLTDNWTEEVDQGNNFDAPTGVFTAPVTGIYSMTASATLINCTIGTGGQILVTRSGGGIWESLVGRSATSQSYTLQTAGIIPMNAGQTLTLSIIGNGEAAATQTLDGSAIGNRQTQFAVALIA